MKYLKPQIWNQNHQIKTTQQQSRNHREWNVRDMKNKIKKTYGEEHNNQTWKTPPLLCSKISHRNQQSSPQKKILTAAEAPPFPCQPYFQCIKTSSWIFPLTAPEKTSFSQLIESPPTASGPWKSPPLLHLFASSSKNSPILSNLSFSRQWIPPSTLKLSFCLKKISSACRCQPTSPF